MKLEVGMYVRYNGQIMKITELGYNNETFMSNGNGWFSLYNCESSHNIIDLIKVGDYVNGFPVIHKENDILKCGLLVQFKENEIKSIVTKEMFSSMEYRLGDDK